MTTTTTTTARPVGEVRVEGVCSLGPVPDALAAWQASEGGVRAGVAW